MPSQYNTNCLTRTDVLKSTVESVSPPYAPSLEEFHPKSLNWGEAPAAVAREWARAILLR